MGIKCEINLCKQFDHFYKPGTTVTGKIKYVLSEEMIFDKITLSLKGTGVLVMQKQVNTGKTQHTQSFRRNEKYVDIDNIILENDTKKIPVPAGLNEIPFSFILPPNIPPTFKYKKYAGGFFIDCKIVYYIRIKFERPGLLKSNKKFKNKLFVGSDVVPTLPLTPIVYGAVRKPFQLFSGKERIVKITSTIENPVVMCEGKLKISYEIVNETTLDIKTVKIKLVECHTFSAKGNVDTKVSEDVKSTEFEVSPVKAGETQTMALIMDIPPNVTTVQHSEMVFRNYFVHITAVLPINHRNAILEMPIEIIENDQVHSETGAPPSYYEAMEELKEEDFDLNENSFDRKCK